MFTVALDGGTVDTKACANLPIVACWLRAAAPLSGLWNRK